jgi:ribosomal protein S18 acetylase RimI-like enzyme
MRISMLALSEVDAVASLAQDCGFHVEPLQELKRDYAHLWVARLNDFSPQPDAFLLAWQAADELEVIALATAAGARRKGLGRALIVELLRSAQRGGVRRVLLEVRQSNYPALNLYRSYGFVIGRTRENYYSNPTEDGVEMALELDCASLESCRTQHPSCSEACR